MRISKRTARKEAVANGFRSKFEFAFSKKLKELNLKAEYEKDKIIYTQPESIRTYTPDWFISHGVYVETKGRFTAADRQKILWVRRSNPKVTVYLLFQNSKVTLSKVSKTTYGMWCDKNSIPWADIKDEVRWSKWFEKK